MLLTNVNFISLSILLVVPYPYYSFKYRSDAWIRKATTDNTVSSLFSTWKENDSSSPPLLSLEDAANRLKVIQFGQKPNQMNGLETSDRSFYLANKAIEVNRVDGSLGINLIEVYSNDDNISGLVLISDASTSDQLMVGDSIIKLSNGERSIDVTGLNYDNTINAFRQFSDDNKVTLTVQRLQRRKEINVKIVGPNNEFVKEFTVISGYGANLRTALQSNNLKMYDERTSRFDSPYQTGDCGGEGTCGTCQVAILEGRELLNDKVRVEEKGLQKQLCPPNYRWSCRVRVGLNPDKGGNVTVKLRPQSTAWDYNRNK